MILIQGWNNKFESADTRKRERLKAFFAPSGCDSIGYLELAQRGSEGLAALGVFQALCQLMATLPRAARVRGAFVRENGQPMTMRQLSLKTGIAEDLLESATNLLASPEVSWVEKRAICHPSAGDVPPSAENLPPSAGSCESLEPGGSATNLPLPATSLPENSGFVQGEGEGEGEVHSLSLGIEIPPVSLEAAISRGAEMMISSKVVISWWQDRDALGWMRKGQPIVRWQSDLSNFAANWKRNETAFGQNQKRARDRDKEKTGLATQSIEVADL